MQLTTTLATLTIFMVSYLWISLQKKAPILSVKAGVTLPKGKSMASQVKSLAEPFCLNPFYDSINVTNKSSSSR